MEKLTNGPTVSVRMTVEMHTALVGMAESDGMDPSEYMRHLIDLRKAEKRAQWEALNQVFGNTSTTSTNTESHGVGRGIDSHFFGERK